MRARVCSQDGILAQVTSSQARALLATPPAPVLQVCTQTIAALVPRLSMHTACMHMVNADMNFPTQHALCLHSYG